MKERNICQYCDKPIFRYRFERKNYVSKWYHAHNRSRMCDLRQATAKLQNCKHCDKVLNSDGTHPSGQAYLACIDAQHEARRKFNASFDDA